MVNLYILPYKSMTVVICTQNKCITNDRYRCIEKIIIMVVMHIVLIVCNFPDYFQQGKGVSCITSLISVNMYQAMVM